MLPELTPKTHPIELIRDIASYNPSKPNNAQLADDMRICFAWYSSLKEGKKFKLTSKDVIALAKKVYAEIEKRKREGKMKHEWNPKGMKPHSKELFNIIIKRSLEELSIKEDAALFWIDSIPQRARIIIDGIDVRDLTPARGSGYYLNPGQHLFELELKDYFLWSEEVTLTKKENWKKTIILTPKSNFNVNSIPDGARIWIDGTLLKDVTPTKNKGYFLDPGTHKIKLYKAGNVFQKEIILLPGEVFNATFTLPSKATFLTDCFSGNSVTANKDMLWNYCCSHITSDMWYNVNTEQRKNIATTIIQNWCPFYKYYGNGNPDCSDCFDWKSAVCLINAVAHVTKLADTKFLKSPFCCHSTVHPAEHDPGICSYFIDCPEGFRLPVHLSNIIRPPDFYHTVATIQIDPEVSLLSSWLFFLYHDIDIQPGSWQMPLGATVSIFKFTGPFNFSCTGFAGYDTLVSWEI